MEKRLTIHKDNIKEICCFNEELFLDLDSVLEF